GYPSYECSEMIQTGRRRNNRGWRIYSWICAADKRGTRRGCEKGCPRKQTVVDHRSGQRIIGRSSRPLAGHRDRHVAANSRDRRCGRVELRRKGHGQLFGLLRPANTVACGCGESGHGHTDLPRIVDWAIRTGLENRNRIRQHRAGSVYFASLKGRNVCQVGFFRQLVPAAARINRSLQRSADDHRASCRGLSMRNVLKNSWTQKSYQQHTKDCAHAIPPTLIRFEGCCSNAKLPESLPIKSGLDDGSVRSFSRW